MENAYVLTGTLTDERTVALDEALPSNVTRVRVTVEPLHEVPKRSYQSVLETIHARQQARGYTPPSREDVDAHLAEERDSWGE